ncbi:MAG: hypothetical protein ACOY4L_12625 [Pseudomonadota bacterium]
MKQLQKLAAFIDGASERERLLILAALTAALVLGSIQFVLDPLQRQVRQINAQIADTQAQQAALAETMQELTQNDPDSPRSPLRQRLARARDELAAVNARLQASGKQFLDDRELARWLDQLLGTERGLRVIGLQSLPAEQVYPAPGAEQKGTPGTPALFRKGVELRFIGSYAATQHYFQRLERSPWPLEWGSLDYRVKNYPLGETTLVVSTYILGPDVDPQTAMGPEVTSAAATASGVSMLKRFDRMVDPGFADANARQNAVVAEAKSQAEGAP